MEDSKKKVVIVIPTYNEVDNIGPLCKRIFAVSEDVQIIVADDNSTDGTRELVLKMSEELGRIRLLGRDGKGKSFSGSYLDGIDLALSMGASHIIQMDADLSHSPSYIPEIISLFEGYDLIIGSRYVKGGGVRNWSFPRRALSRSANLFLSFVLGIRIKDITSGFMGWRSVALAKISKEDLDGRGFIFLTELKNAACRNKLSIKEIPIIFEDRINGESKISRRIIIEGIIYCMKRLFWR